MQAHDYTQTLRRATTGRSVLGWVALACLVLNGAFWGTLMLDLLKPRSPLSPQAIQAGLSIAAFALVLPLAWSSILPNSPAMRLLQKSSWALPGQLAFTVSAVFLTWLASNWLYMWWSAQPSIAETGQATLLTVSSLIAGTLVPALSWATMTPEAWIAHIEQARQVRRLEHAMRMEEAAMRASYARAVSLLNAGLCNLTIDQRKELGGILGGFARVQQQALQGVANSWKDMYGVEAELGLVDDQALLDQYGKVVNALADGSNAMLDVTDHVSEITESRALHVPQRDHVNPRLQPSIPREARDDTRRHMSSPDDAYATAAWQHFGPRPWTIKKLAAHLDLGETKTKELRDMWMEQGIVENANLGRWYFTEHEER